MTERSRFWDGTTLGDASEAPYSAQEFFQVMLGMLAQNNTSPWQRSFVGMGAGYGVGSLLVTGTATPVSIAAGTAVVAGMWYENDASTTLAVSTPGANPRRDRVVLRADWAAQTVRLALLAGAEAATPTAPALTQTFGTTWEVSLATVYITTGGVITVTDERVGNIGLGNSVLFRDIAGRWHEEFFENFSGLIPYTGNTASPWNVVLSSGTIAGAGGESAVQLNTTATNGWSAQIGWGNNNSPTQQYQLELSKAPILFEARIAMSAAFDGQVSNYMRINSAAGGAITFGMIGSVSTTNLVLQASNAGPTNFTTGQAGDATGAYHTYGIYLPAVAGPAFAIYDGVVIGQVAASLPASTTNVTAQFFVGNGTTAADRVQKIDWARWVRGAA